MMTMLCPPNSRRAHVSRCTAQFLLRHLLPEAAAGIRSAPLGQSSTEQPSRQNTLVANQHSGTHSVLLVC